MKYTYHYYYRQGSCIRSTLVEFWHPSGLRNKGYTNEEGYPFSKIASLLLYSFHSFPFSFTLLTISFCSLVLNSGASDLRLRPCASDLTVWENVRKVDANG